MEKTRLEGKLRTLLPGCCHLHVSVRLRLVWAHELPLAAEKNLALVQAATAELLALDSVRD
jgi:hypothetical protein